LGSSSSEKAEEEPPIQAAGIAIRWAHLVIVVALVGATTALVLAGRSDRATAEAWQRATLRASCWLVVLALISGVATLAHQAALASGQLDALLRPQIAARVLFDTHAGRVWLIRHGLVLLLAAFLFARPAVASSGDWLALRAEAGLLGLLALGLLAAGGHAAAVEPWTAGAIAVDAIHLAATGVWLGGLLPLGRLLSLASREGGADARPYAVLAARRFSRMALLAVIILVVTGGVNTINQVGSVPALVGTPYGRLLLVKLGVLGLLLAVARINRTRYLPQLGGEAVTVGRPAMRALARAVVGETALGLGLLAVVAAMTLSPPAVHLQPTWPFGARFSSATLQAAPAFRSRVFAGAQVAVLGGVAVLCSMLVRRRRTPVLVVAGVLLASGAVLALPPLVIDAYPTTYYRPTVRYAVGSIDRGRTLYGARCAGCHGPSGAGDGPATRSTRVRPADLRAQHTADHTAGDLFWWITHGIVRSGMPGVGEQLSESQRWDLVNFVRALAAVETVRRLGPAVESTSVRVAAPDFGFVVGPTPPRALHDYRGRRVVLVVLYTLPGSRPRLAQLADAAGDLALLGAEIIAVPTDAAPDAIRRIGPAPRIFFPVVTGGAQEIVDAYGLFTRAPHTEFLIDRQGYLRARQALDAGETPDVKLLAAGVQQLNEETPLGVDAGEHAH
jgi:putative copper export protein/mono/diheme cytochrome c family protein